MLCPTARTHDELTPYEAERRYLLYTIRQIQLDCERQMKPYIDRLCRLEATRPPSSLFVEVAALDDAPNYPLPPPQAPDAAPGTRPVR